LSPHEPYADLPPRGDGDEPVFDEPWQAHAFALAVTLHDRGLFTWSRWTQTLGQVIAEAGGTGRDGEYYAHWLTALERLVVENGVADGRELLGLREAWRRAAAETPHGEPIELGRGRCD